VIWTFKIVCESGVNLEDDWIREIEINSENTLADLHSDIINIIGFDNDHLYDFFGGRRLSNRAVIFSENESWEEREDVFSSTTLENMMPYRAKKQKHHMPDHICPYFKTNAIIPQYGNCTERIIYAKANLPGKLGEFSC